MTALRGTAGIALAVLVLSIAPNLRAESTDAADSSAVFGRGVTALESGSYEEAILAFEALADRGFFHPDASFDRALAYLARVRAKADKPGDLGRAAAGFEETLSLRPEDREAESALQLVRADVARRRAREGRSAEVEARPSIERAVVEIASERTWTIAALVSSLLLTLGLLARSLTRNSQVHLATALAIPIGGFSLVFLSALAFEARRVRLTTDEAVVVVSEAYLTDDRGRVSAAGSIPEAARVTTDASQGDRVHVRWGTIDGWLPLASVRKLPRATE